VGYKWDLMGYSEPTIGKSKVAGLEIPDQNGCFNAKITYKWWIFHCHVSLPLG
jgi:hypothetical protein